MRFRGAAIRLGGSATDGRGAVDRTTRRRLFSGGHFEYMVTAGDALVLEPARREISERSAVHLSFHPGDSLLSPPTTEPRSDFPCP